jgi:phosphoribosylformimino-5-aminoimidazole carboxamide ribonucleotide (ProFAR) isomerase
VQLRDHRHPGREASRPSSPRPAAPFPDRIIVGLDARDGRVATDGWAECPACSATDLARRFAADGVSAIVYTDIARDGMMQGVNIEATLDSGRGPRRFP